MEPPRLLVNALETAAGVGLVRASDAKDHRTLRVLVNAVTEEGYE
jgi:hypothetical protein